MSRKYILVHGAWQGKWAWEVLAERLRAEGNEVSCFDLPGSGDDLTPSGQVTLNSCAERIIQKTRELSTAGDVILVGHSLGGAAVTQAASAAPELYCRVVYICAFLPVDDESVLQLSQKSVQLGTGGPVTPIDMDAGGITLVVSHIPSTFFNDGNYVDYHHLIKKFRPQALGPLVTPVKVSESFNSLKKSYVICTLDKAVSPDFQKIMAERSRVEDLYEINSGNEPFIIACARLSEILNFLP